MRLKIKEDGSVDFGNPSRRCRPFVYQIIKSNYNEITEDIYNTYCIQDIKTKKIDYFIEVCPKDGEEYIIRPSDLGKKNFSLRDCRYIIKKLILGSKYEDLFSK